MSKNFIPIYFFVGLTPLISGLLVVVQIMFTDREHASLSLFLGLFLIYTAGAYVYGFFPSLCAGIVAHLLGAHSKIIIVLSVVITIICCSCLIGWVSSSKDMIGMFIIYGGSSGLLTAIIYVSSPFFKKIGG